MKRNLLIICVLILVTVVLYANGRHGQFISDDHTNIEENIIIQDLHRYFTKHFSWRMGELVYIIYAINWHFSKDNPLSYHISSQFFHILNIILVFFLIEALFKNNLLAFLTALLFCVHTVNTQVVDWISAVGYAVMGIFYLSSILLYVRFRSHYQNFKLYVVALIVYWLGLYNGFILATVPLILLAYEFLLVKEKAATFKEHLKYCLLIIPYFLSVVVYAFIAVGANIISKRMQVCNELWIQHYKTTALPNHIAIIAKLFIYYIKLLFWPYRLGISHRFAYNFALIDSKFYASIFIILLLLALIFVLRRRQKEISFGIAWYFIAILPFSNIIHIASDIAERYLYLPSIGFCLIISYLVLKIPLAFKRRLNREQIAVVATILFLAVFMYYAILTVRRNSEYRTQISFWESNLRYFPNNGFVLNDLANAYYRAGRVEDAIKSYQEALKLNPLDPKANYNLGVVYQKKGMLREALVQYQRTLSVAPDDHKAHFNLGTIYEENGMLKEAMQEYRLAIKIMPTYFNSQLKLGILLQRQNLFKEAIEVYQKALYLMPNSTAIHSNLGAAYYNIGQVEKARREIAKAIELDPNFAQAHYNLGILEAKEKNLDVAEKALAKLKELNSNLRELLEKEILRQKR